MMTTQCEDCGRDMDVSEGRFALAVSYGVPIVCRACRDVETHECVDCGREKVADAFGDPKVNLVTNEREWICRRCWRRGALLF
jgi:hypothetical protein